MLSVVFDDQYGNQYQRGDRLGAGGQGAVYRVEGEPALALKMQVIEGTDTPVFGGDGSEFRELMMLPLPVDLPLAKPIAALNGVRGYVMQLVVGLRPAATVISARVAEPTALHPALEEVRKLLLPHRWSQYYSYGQAMPPRQRLLVSASIASTLARLHGLGFVYKDISPGNCFVPEARADSRAWLIDCDNLGPSGRGLRVYTPGYGAPEVTTLGQPNSFAADAFSLAVLTYEIVTGKHPFDGPLRNIGGSAWDDEETESDREQRDAVSGEAMWEQSLLPFIEAQTDESNHVPNFFSVALGSRLANVYESLLGEGREHPLLRASAAFLASELARAGYLCCSCTVCKIGQHAENVGADNVCSVCGEPIGTRWGAWLREGAGRPEQLVFVSESDVDSFDVPLSVVFPPRMRSISAAWIRVSLKQVVGAVRIEAIGAARKIRILIDGRLTEPAGVVEVPTEHLLQGLLLSDAEVPGLSVRIGVWGSRV